MNISLPLAGIVVACLELLVAYPLYFLSLFLYPLLPTALKMCYRKLS